MTIQEAKNTVSSSLPSIWSREDVLALLDKVQVKPLSNDQINELTNDIVGEIENEGIDIIDDYKLVMNSREVELDNVNINSLILRELINDTIESYLIAETTA